MANLFALADGDPEFLEQMEERLTRSGEFERVWRPSPGWIAARDPLPECESDPDVVCSRGFAFVEGRDRLERRDHRWLDRLAELCDSSPHRLAQLPGDFGFMRFRPDGTALVVRSCGGLVPLYLHRREGGGLVVGTRLNYFPRLLPDRFLPDPLINSSWDRTPMILIDHRTFVRGVSILPRASHTELASGRPSRTGTYWDPRPDVGEEPQSSPEHPRELRRILLETLSRDLDPAGRNLLLLSGGVDSSALAALIAGTLGRRLSSWSFIPGMEPDRSHALAYIEPLVADFGIGPSHIRELNTSSHRRWLADTPGLPFQVIHPALCDLGNVCAGQQVRVLVSGMFADEVCGDSQRMNDWVLHTSLRALLTGAPVPSGRRDYLRWAKRRVREYVGRPQIPAAPLPSWVRPEVADEYRAWVRGHQAALAADRRPLRELAARASADYWVAMYWEGAASLGVRPVLPFFSREVLELAFSCHPRELLGPGPKRLLRDALRADVPEKNLMRPDRGMYHAHQDGPWGTIGPLPPVAEPMVRDDWLPVPPADLRFWEGKLLMSATRVAEYLEREGAAPSLHGLRSNRELL